MAGKSFFLRKYESLINLPYKIHVALLKRQFGLLEKGANILPPVLCCNYPGNVFMHEYAHIRGNCTILNTPNAKFVMGKKSRAAQNLMVITQNHQSPPVLGSFYHDIATVPEHNPQKDVIVEEDVWIGSNVTLLPGVTIGRGAIVGSNSVCTKSLPAYGIAVGNPAKVIKFKFTPAEILEHERQIYPENQRMLLSDIQQIQDKYAKAK